MSRRSSFEWRFPLQPRTPRPRQRQQLTPSRRSSSSSERTFPPQPRTPMPRRKLPDPLDEETYVEPIPSWADNYPIYPSQSPSPISSPLTHPTAEAPAANDDGIPHSGIDRIMEEIWAREQKMSRRLADLRRGIHLAGKVPDNHDSYRHPVINNARALPRHPVAQLDFESAERARKKAYREARRLRAEENLRWRLEKHPLLYDMSHKEGVTERMLERLTVDTDPGRVESGAEGKPTGPGGAVRRIDGSR
ncbi:hypothetical protein DFH27DRAFT_524242 [Peziza echinospora]|nr:hypothetical protein DFH27DRAFT_524242 [Peziza echinospora]